MCGRRERNLLCAKNRCFGRAWRSIYSLRQCPRYLSSRFPQPMSSERCIDSPPYPVTSPCEHGNCENCYVGYPQSHFPNWSHRQLVKSRIHHAIHEYNWHKPCTLYRLDIVTDGAFRHPGPLVATSGHDSAVWEQFKHDKVGHMSYHSNFLADISVIAATN